MVGQPGDLRLVGVVERRPGRQLDALERLLLELGVELDLGRPQAAAAGLGQGGPDVAVDEQSAVRPGQPDARVGRPGEGQVSAEVELEPVEGEVADGATRLAEQGRDVDRQRVAWVGPGHGRPERVARASSCSASPSQASSSSSSSSSPASAGGPAT